MRGFAPWHVRILCNNPFEGGLGYTPQQVGDLTLDEAFMLMTDKAVLRRSGKLRAAPVAAMAAAALADKDGLIAGRDRDGNPIKGRVAGKSRARQLMEAKAAREAEAAAASKQPRRRKRGQ